MEMITEIRWEKNVYIITQEGEMVGSLLMDRCGEHRDIRNVTVTPEYRGQGYYRKMLIAALGIDGVKSLISTARVTASNNCYRHWTGDPDLKGGDTVFITLENGQLKFTH